MRISQCADATALPVTNPHSAALHCTQRALWCLQHESRSTPTHRLVAACSPSLTTSHRALGSLPMSVRLVRDRNSAKGPRMACSVHSRRPRQLPFVVSILLVHPASWDKTRRAGSAAELADGAPTWVELASTPPAPRAAAGSARPQPAGRASQRGAAAGRVLGAHRPHQPPKRHCRAEGVARQLREGSSAAEQSAPGQVSLNELCACSARSLQPPRTWDGALPSRCSLIGRRESSLASLTAGTGLACGPPLTPHACRRGGISYWFAWR